MVYLTTLSLDQNAYHQIMSFSVLNSESFARPDWKKQLKGRHFSSDAEVIAAAETWLDGQTSDFFFDWLAKVRVWSL